VCSQNCKKWLLALSCLFVCLSFYVHMKQLSSHWMDFYEIWCLNVFQKSFEKIQVLLKSDKIMGALHNDLCTFVIVAHWILLEMRNFSDKSHIENQKHILYSITFFLKIVPFRQSCGKIRQSQTGHRWHTMAQTLCMMDK